jgi:hypothetical protein
MKQRSLVKGRKQTPGFNAWGPYWGPAAKSLALVLVVVFGLFSILASGGSSSSSGSSSSGSNDDAEAVSSYEMPTEISSVPVKTDAEDNSASLNSMRALRSIARAATDSGTDYSDAVTRKYVEEHSLKQFSILETILKALAQTNYTEEIGNGAYKAMVAWEEENNGVDQKTLECWVVQADAITVDGEPALRARAWIEEQEEGETQLVKAEFKIYAPPTQNDDGSYADYGEWDLNVSFGDDTENDFFAASCTVNDDGLAVIKIHEKFLESGPASEVELPVEMAGIMYRSETEGYGKVTYPDWDAMYGPDAEEDLDEFPMITALYSYNEDYVAVKEDDNDTDYKDRNEIVEMTHRYGVFNADTGENIMKSKSFGFPIMWTTNGITKRAYYGAWQGRHQLWTQSGGTIEAGTEVTREDYDPDATPETYVVGPTFNGTLTKRTYVDASLDDIKDIPVEIWIDNNYNLTYVAAQEKWYHCPRMNWEAFPPECAETPVDFDAEIGLTSLVVGANDTRKQVHINRWDDELMENKTYVYERASDDNSGAGFYEATEDFGDFGMIMVVDTPRVKLTPSDGDQLWIWTGGQIYVAYTGTGATGWVEKELINFDQMTWTPEFGDNDLDFILPENRELYINMQGANFVVRKNTGEDATCKIELQTAVNPNNITDVLGDSPDDVEFQDPWNPEASSTYQFITDPDDDNFLMLVYKTIGDNDKDQNGDPNDGVEVGGIVSNVWGVEAVISGVTTAFNWEYNADGGWGAVSYLLEDDGETYKLLDDPVRFNSITASNGADEEKTLSLQYDGWLFGMPEMYQELEKNSWTMNQTIADKIINLPAGTELVDAVDATEYLLKPLEVSQFLMVTAETEGLPDITLGEGVDLSTVPDFTDHGMGDIPTGVVLLYSEGEPVDE